MTGARHQARTDARVTVGMPVFNNARTLRRAIDSVLGQGFSDWVLVISDDGSTDGSDRIAAHAATADPRISLLRQPQPLGFMNFRAPLASAETPYFVWLAVDDHWHPDFLEHTLRALDAAPAAVSALPQATFIGSPERPVPNLGFLRGDASRRITQYLRHPGGTRMYGLMRTGLLAAAFPPRPFNAYDWYLMVALLAKGPQLSLPQQLLFREETPWFRYAEAVDSLSDRGLHRSFPVLEMSLELIRDRHIPRRALPALAGLNLRKHEEYVAVTRPDTFRRRKWLYRLAGLPIAGDPARQAELSARDPAPAAASRLPGPAANVRYRGAGVTAILTFRNAASTLAAAFEHLEALGCDVIAIDHGSTDGSRDIAASSQQAGRCRIIDSRWTGAFDLHRQLAQKCEIIAGLSPGWVLHADADEFLEPPPGQSLADCIVSASSNGQIAFPVTEQLFVPRYEDEEHDPQNFRKTMTAFVQMHEHDAKQRLFRSDADLALWMRTGGHTVTRDPERLAPPLVLQHFPGLSLDDLRAQYHARVFAPGDRARLWHDNRSAAHAFDIVEPDPALFCKASPSDLRRLPFFRPRAPYAAPPLPVPADLYLVDGGAGGGHAALLQAALPGLRIATVDASALWGMTQNHPVLNILGHPAGLHGHNVQRSLERSRAVEWTRRIAQARQWALDRNAVYAELRIEEVQPGGEALRDCLLRLLQPRAPRGATGFVPIDSPAILRGPFENPVRAITAPLSADLGYR